MLEYFGVIGFFTTAGSLAEFIRILHDDKPLTWVRVFLHIVSCFGSIGELVYVSDIADPILYVPSSIHVVFGLAVTSLVVRRACIIAQRDSTEAVYRPLERDYAIYEDDIV